MSCMFYFKTNLRPGSFDVEFFFINKQKCSLSYAEDILEVWLLKRCNSRGLMSCCFFAPVLLCSNPYIGLFVSVVFLWRHPIKTTQQRRSIIFFKASLDKNTWWRIKHEPRTPLLHTKVAMFVLMSWLNDVTSSLEPTLSFKLGHFWIE